MTSEEARAILERVERARHGPIVGAQKSTAGERDYMCFCECLKCYQTRNWIGNPRDVLFLSCNCGAQLRGEYARVEFYTDAQWDRSLEVLRRLQLAEPPKPEEPEQPWNAHQLINGEWIKVWVDA